MKFGIFRATFWNIERLLPCVLLLFCINETTAQVAQSVITKTQPALVKIYGSGGYANLHAYQSGFYYSKDGKIATAWSHVLDGKITVVSSDGSRNSAQFVGMDPETEIAILKVDKDAASFVDLNKSTKPVSGMNIAAFSNLFGIATGDEKQSVMMGVVSAITNLDGKFGQFETPYRGNVIITDLITNNPGAAGGLVVDHRGQPIGMIGKELKDRGTGVWLNYCLPTLTVEKSIKAIESGIRNRAPEKKVPSPFRLTDIGLELIPQVVETTRPYVDRTLPGSSAERLGFQPDDLIVFLNGNPVRTILDVHNSLKTIDRDSQFQVILRRKNSLVTVKVKRQQNNSPREISK